MNLHLSPDLCTEHSCSRIIFQASTSPADQVHPPPSNSSGSQKSELDMSNALKSTHTPIPEKACPTPPTTHITPTPSLHSPLLSILTNPLPKGIAWVEIYMMTTMIYVCKLAEKQANLPSSSLHVSQLLRWRLHL